MAKPSAKSAWAQDCQLPYLPKAGDSLIYQYA
jgi:hypothetical protein